MDKHWISGLLLTVLLMCRLSLCDKDIVSSNEDVPQPSPHRDIDDQLDGPLQPVYEMVEVALEGMIQPEYLTDLEEELGMEFMTPQDFVDSFEEHWEQWTVYFIGYAILAAIGVFLILIVPLVGMIVACCRCCGNCGGRPKAMESKCSTCKRVCCGVTFFIVTSAITLGVVCMFAFNTEIHRKLHNEQGNLWDELSKSLHEVDTYFDDTVDQMDEKILEEYVGKKGVLIETLEEIPNEAVEYINNITHVKDDFDILLSFSENMTMLNDSLVSANNTQVELAARLEDLTSELQTLVNETSVVLDGCSTAECEAVINATSLLAVNITVSNIDLNNVTFLVQLNLQQNLSQYIESSAQEIDAILQAVNSSVDAQLDEVIQYANEIQTEIETFINDTSDKLNEVDFDKVVETLDEVKENISEEVEIAYWAVVAFGVPLCIIVFCGFIGLLLGIVCPRPSPNNGCCSADRTRGSDAILAGIGFTFIFYWIYALVVLPMFLAGGVTHTEVCRHLVNYDEAESADVVQIMDRMFVYQLNESLDVEISPFDAYTSCGANQSFYRAFDLENNGYNISEIIDVADIKEAIDDIKAVPIEIPQVNIMNDTLQQALHALGSEFDSLDFALYYEDLNGPVTTVDLSYIIDLLKLIKQNGTVNETEIDELIQKFTEVNDNLVQTVTNLTTHLIHDLQMIEELLPDTSLVTLTDNLKEDETIINTNGTALIGAYVNDTADELYGQTVDFTDQMISTVENDLGRCEPLYDALTSTIDTVCVNTLYPLNGFWFSLGWCLVFLIPSIIIAFILADEYRKAHPYMEGIDTHFDEPDQAGYDAYAGVPDYWTYDNSTASGVQMYQLPRAQLKPEKNQAPSSHHQNDGMAAFDNPIYANDEELKIPRPTVIPTPYYPPSTLQKMQQQNRQSPSPPPSYRASIATPDRVSMDGNYDTKM